MRPSLERLPSLALTVLLVSLARASAEKENGVPVYGNCTVEFAHHIKGKFGPHDLIGSRDASELERRREIFCTNLEKIKEHNVRWQEHGFVLGLNHLAHVATEELGSRIGAQPLNYEDTNVALYAPTEGAGQLPDAVDFRSKMPKAKNQNMCGSCWAFSAIDVVDFHAPGSHSEQQILDCSGRGDCDGGVPYGALQYLQQAGSDSEEEYSYTSGWGKKEDCKSSQRKPIANVTNVRSVRGEDDLKAAASSQVVSVSIVGGDSFYLQFYQWGIFDHSCGSKDKGHALGVVGYGNKDGTDYWIIRNSWGSWWGMSGYMYFKRGDNLCDVATRGCAIADASPI